jgi:cytochrome c oxidase assembly protein subunit 15
MSLIAWIQLLLIGAAIGAVLLLIMWWRFKQFSFHRLVLLTVFFTFDLILFGAFTRLSDSGLGCPDWPGCYGVSNPVAALAQIREAESLMPDGPVTLSKAWIEMLHRYFAMGVGFLIIIMVVWSWIKKQVIGANIAKTSIGILILVCVQGAFGAWTVTLKLQPVIVTIHLMLGLGLLAGLTYLSSLSARLEPSSNLVPIKTEVPFKKIAWIVLAVLVLQIFLGGWVSTNYAVLACDDFPLCHGAWYPEMNFSEGFTFWRDLGKSFDGSYLSVEALRAIHWTHRVGAIFAVLAVFYLAFKLWLIAKDNSAATFKFWAMSLFGLGLLQVITGMSNIILDWPLAAAVLHTGGAAAMVFVMIRVINIDHERASS